MKKQNDLLHRLVLWTLRLGAIALLSLTLGMVITSVYYIITSPTLFDKLSSILIFIIFVFITIGLYKVGSLIFATRVD
jgi:hypothetical protein